MAIMRIDAGVLKGWKFKIYAETLITPAVIRRSLFDFINDRIQGTRWLDLYSGSGSIGLEALSRGAENVILVEKFSRCLEDINQAVDKIIANPEVLQGLGRFKVEAMDGIRAIKHFHAHNKHFDVLFCHPPVNHGVLKKALKTIEAYDILAPQSYAVFVLDCQEFVPKRLQSFEIVKDKIFSQWRLLILKKIIF